ncbi:hypothetical protein [Metabacillus endolithicus]|uniref:hypothetical protein n=1 Tax=Metabacillus endolithicus TaxID=1535204 RepID=UPI001FF81795|nr:hypothetical protein [Metabacillus endolithicus]UPG66049.1 hypothetical protein MVE64_26775 [Metabacillus endolithicus]
MQKMQKLLILLFFLISLIGCEKESKVKQINYIKEGIVEDLDKYTSMTQVEQDLDGNGSKEIITMYVGPALENEGKTSIHDVDEVYYRLIVEDGEKEFSLINFKKDLKNIVEVWFEEKDDGYEIVIFFDGENREIISYNYDKKI